MPTIEIDIELYCETCGEGICALGTATHRRGQPCFRIDACETCTSRADAAGYERGYSEGYDKAKDEYAAEM